MAQEYEHDEDGHPREVVGPWVKDKHTRLAKYVGISRSVRKKFIGPNNAGATFIDLFAGPGRIRIRDEEKGRHGSPLVAWHEAISGDSPFTQMHVADENDQISESLEARLTRVNAPVFPEIGTATQTVDAVVSKLNPYALHFAFLDPYNLGSLHFDIIRKLAKFQRMDILIHVSLQDLQRNLNLYIDQKESPLDAFAPGWRDHVDIERRPEVVRPKLLEYWRSLLKAESMETTEVAELVVGSKNQRLYLLAFAARHGSALEFWEKVRHIDGDREPLLL